MNSRNYRYLPEKTTEWFKRLGDLLESSSQLTAQGDYTHAVVCFTMLYELIEAMEWGKEIVFAEECGSWMIPGNEKQYIATYMAALAATSTPEEFTRTALPLIRRDSRQSFAKGAYASATSAATPVQRAHLELEIVRQKIRTGRDPTRGATVDENPG